LLLATNRPRFTGNFRNRSAEISGNAMVGMRLTASKTALFFAAVRRREGIRMIKDSRRAQPPHARVRMAASRPGRWPLNLGDKIWGRILAATDIRDVSDGGVDVEI
jgi:hypothetical protein